MVEGIMVGRVLEDLKGVGFSEKELRLIKSSIERNIETHTSKVLVKDRVEDDWKEAELIEYLSTANYPYKCLIDGKCESFRLKK